MKAFDAPWIKLKEKLDQEDFTMIRELQEECCRSDDISLKLELDYKLAAAREGAGTSVINETNEFMYFYGQRLIGYIGICDFGRPGSPLEMTGMVHPEYRRQGIFSILHENVLAECKRRNSAGVLLLSDNRSYSGQSFIDKTGAEYKNSEFEMYLKKEHPVVSEKLLCGITFRRARNADAYEICRQNTIYFEDGDYGDESPIMPEDEEKRGMIIYLAEKENQVVGKVHLQMNTTIGGIYGLGVLPEFRGKGYGRAILLKAVEMLKESNPHAIMLQVAAENAKALRLYQSCGFMETSTMDYYILK